MKKQIGIPRISSRAVQFVNAQPLGVYYLVLLGLLAFYVFRWPIIFIDTDLWRHLDSGRYLAQHGVIPSTTYFSFLTPVRAHVEYAWLFQALVYNAHAIFQYHGLIILRSVIYLATVVIVFAFLIRQRPHGGSFLYPALLGICYALSLLARDQIVRPHLFSYLFIVLILYLLEYYPRRLILLPFLGALWCNMHGIMYPLLLWICFAYGLEYLFRRHMGLADATRYPRLFLALILLTMATVFLTPHGVRLLGAPFLPIETYSPFTVEQYPVTWEQMLSVEIRSLVPSYQTVFNVVLVAAGATIVATCVRRQLRLSHVMLAVAGLMLLPKGIRFRVEFLLLVLPLLAAHPWSWRVQCTRRAARYALASVVAILMLAVPWRFLEQKFGTPPRYPISTSGLPEGIARFLNHVGVGGKVVNWPESGGYLRWRLSSAYKILMDKQFAFTPEDYFTGYNVFSNRQVLGEVVAHYDPSFIIVPIEGWESEQLISDLTVHRPVWFDETGVLYANAQHHPRLVAEYELSAFRPFTLWRDGIGADLIRENRGAIMGELQRMLDIDPHGFMANHVAAVVQLHAGAYNKSLTFAQELIDYFPERHMGYHLRADALRALGLFSDAVESYKMAWRRSEQPGVRRELLLRVGTTYQQAEQYTEAYRVLKNVVDPFAPQTTYQELYALGVSALFAKKHREAARILRLAARKVPSTDVEWHARLRAIESSASGIGTSERKSSVSNRK